MPNFVTLANKSCSQDCRDFKGHDSVKCVNFRWAVRCGLSYNQNETEYGCSSTATERPDASLEGAGSRPAIRFLSHSTFCPSNFLDGPLRLGYLVKSFGTSGLISRAIGQPMGSQLALCPSHFYRAESRRLSNSMVEYRPIKAEAAGSTPVSDAYSCPMFPVKAVSTGRRIGLSFITTKSRVRVPPPVPDAGVAQW